MAILGAASSAVIQAFETCGLSPIAAHGGSRTYDPCKGRAAWLTGGNMEDMASGNSLVLASGSPSRGHVSPQAGRSPAASAGRSPAASEAGRSPAASGGSSPPASGRHRQSDASPGAWDNIPLPPPPPPPPPRVGTAAARRAADPEAQRRREKQLQRVEELIEELFNLHDLNHNGVLEELELIKLNEKIAMLHYGRDTDKQAIRDKFSNLFRSELDPEGRPVQYCTFRGYMLKLLDSLDRSKQAQELILEQFVEEAKSGRLAFHCQSFQSVTDEPFRKMIEQHYK